MKPCSQEQGFFFRAVKRNIVAQVASLRGAGAQGLLITCVFGGKKVGHPERSGEERARSEGPRAIHSQHVKWRVSLGVALA